MVHAPSVDETGLVLTIIINPQNYKHRGLWGGVLEYDDEVHCLGMITFIMKDKLTTSMTLSWWWK